MISKEIKKYLKPEHTVLEWGSGESTKYFPQFVKKWISIEHDEKWCCNTTNELAKKYGSWEEYNTGCGKNYIIENIVYKFIPPEVSNEHFQDWKNIPLHPYWNTEKKEKWLTVTKYFYPNGCDYTYERAYQLDSYIWVPVADDKYHFNIAIVDGRARSMCAFAVKSKLTKDGLVLFDDYFGREQWHSDVTTEYKIIEKISNLAVMKPIK
tara:strand:- start:2074 stop:2700 length:627 start_codon:yes stop_codon:yes gene_type:complete